LKFLVGRVKNPPLQAIKAPQETILRLYRYFFLLSSLFEKKNAPNIPLKIYVTPIKEAYFSS
jgi:hypothetical protein